MQRRADAPEKVPPTPTDTEQVHAWSEEDDFSDLIEELPGPEQIQRLIAYLPTRVLRRMATDLLQQNVRIAKDTSLYPYTFVRELSSWVATAQEVAASKRGVGRVLRDRNEMKGAH